MPHKASDYPWWKWLLIAAIGAALCVGSIFLNNSGESYWVGKNDQWFLVIIAIIGFIVAVICGLIGIIRFIKWAWAD